MDPSRDETVLRLAVERGLLDESVRQELASRSISTGRSILELAREERLLSDADLTALAGDSAAVTGSDAPHPRITDFPVKHWDRYEFVRYVGGGGMGRVFEAFDPRLGRTVALKFLYAHSPEALERFQTEAHAQARVDHDRVCRVYEVDEVEGHPYIAMQFIDGKPLSVTAAGMNLEQKLLVMKEVAEGLHEAHRIGLVHRDVKPANIMVASHRPGEWKPYITDFGLVRESESVGMTVTGAILGTPGFMSPEQARGSSAGVDRRTDVYGLGACLYAILTGRVPFSEETVAATIMKVIHDDPPSPRSLVPDLPVDVVSIVEKCLRKDPSERYGSARELAEDLGRYLDGEPIRARPTTIVHRLKMKARKNRVAVAVGLLALPIILASVGWGAYNAWTSTRKQQLAQAFGQQMQRIDQIARLSAMTPIHDVAADRALIREQMAAIEDRIANVGRLARGPGEYALARGHLALKEYDDARAHLEAAQAAGHAGPEAAYALGLVLSELYRRQLHTLESFVKESDRERERRRIEQEFRDPALAYLRSASEIEVESPDYLAGLLALLQDEYGEALAQARSAFATHSWQYEAKRLESHVHSAVADTKIAAGEYEEAVGMLEQARNALEAGLAVAPSDPGIYKDLADVALQRMALELNHRGLDVEEQFRRGVEAIDLALKIDDTDPEAYVFRSRLYRRLAQYRTSANQDASAELAEAVAAAERGLALDPDDAGIHRHLLVAHRNVAEGLRQRGGDPREAYEKAIRSYDALRRADESYVIDADGGLLFRSLARYQMEIGEDPRENLRLAIAAYERAIEVAPNEMALHYNLGNVHSNLGRYAAEHGGDPLPAYRAAVGSFERALEIRPGHLIVLYGLGSTYGDLATFELSRGGDPSEWVDRALGALSEGIRSQPESAYLPYLLDGRGLALLARAQYERSHGIDPEETMRAAIAEFESAIEANPDYLYPYGNLSALLAERAAHREMLGDDPSSAAAEAIRRAEAALVINPSHVPAQVNLAQALCTWARYRIEHGEDPRADLERASSVLATAGELNPDYPLVHHSLGEVHLAWAVWKAASRLDPTSSLEASRRALERCLELDPRDEAALVVRAVSYLREAEWNVDAGRSATEAIDHGLQSADAARELNPAAYEGTAVRAALLGLRWKVGSDRADLERARADLDEALRGNHHLTRLYGDSVDGRAPGLASGDRPD